MMQTTLLHPQISGFHTSMAHLIVYYVSLIGQYSWLRYIFLVVLSQNLGFRVICGCDECNFSIFILHTCSCANFAFAPLTYRNRDLNQSFARAILSSWPPRHQKNRHQEKNGENWKQTAFGPKNRRFRVWVSTQSQSQSPGPAIYFVLISHTHTPIYFRQNKS